MGSPRLGWRGQEIKASPLSGGEGLSCPKSPSQETEENRERASCLGLKLVAGETFLFGV